MSVKFPKDIRQIKRIARRQGWRVDHTGGQHCRFTSPAGDVYVTACSPSDHRAIHNLISGLRALGLRPSGAKGRKQKEKQIRSQ